VWLARSREFLWLRATPPAPPVVRPAGACSGESVDSSAAAAGCTASGRTTQRSYRDHGAGRSAARRLGCAAQCTCGQQASGTRAPPPRMIVPQTGPRPVYKAPPPKPVQPGVPIASRPVPGRPVPGQPIFQRQRPQVPGGPRPPLRPGERRPMHPTRSSPTGARPLGVGPGAPLGAPPGPIPSGAVVRVVRPVVPDSATFRAG